MSTFERAVAAYFEWSEDQYPNGSPNQPNKSLSMVSDNGLVTLHNVNGFLAQVMVGKETATVIER